MQGNGFDLQVLLHDMPMPLPLVDLDRVMREERTGYHAHLDSMVGLLRESERERELLHQQLALIKELLARQDASAIVYGRQAKECSTAKSSAAPASSSEDSIGISYGDGTNYARQDASVNFEYIKTVIIRYLETDDSSLLPVLQEVTY